MVDFVGAYAVAIIMPTASTIFIFLRYVATAQRQRLWAPDNFVLTFGLVLVWILSGLFLNGASRQIFGGHTPINPVTHQVVITKQGTSAAALEWGFILVDRLAFGVIKIGVVLWYRSIFVDRAFKRVSTGLMVVLASWSLTFFFLALFGCGSHPSLAWSSNLKATVKKCLNSQLIQVTFTITDVFADLIVLSLPIHWVLKLQMTTRKKVGVISSFMLGLISTGAGIARMAIWIWIAYKSDTFDRDFLGLLTTVLTWSLVSTNTAIIGACLPSMLFLFRLKTVERMLRSILRFSRNISSSISAAVIDLLPPSLTQGSSREEIPASLLPTGKFQAEEKKHRMKPEVLVRQTA